MFAFFSSGGLPMSKTIILLADGTGNGAAKLFKSNVWRLYKALDLSDPPPAGKRRQIAYYHDGVGTSTFKPLTILGGVFGVGLKRNIVDMYLFLCRNYEPGDRICVFGFSRGAFTARVLASVITTQGILDCHTEDELHRYARDVYRRYRRRYKLPLLERKNKTVELKDPEKKKVGIVDRIRDLRDFAIKAWRGMLKHEQYDSVHERNRKTSIDFIGVWDTVAAYGLPIDEMTRGIDEWVWPLSMPNYALSTEILRARHALSLDDERDTFHPLLWDEVAEQKLVEADPSRAGRLQQVWFSGMHSNVGGGYADDSLSYGALEWIMQESAKPVRDGDVTGLRFLPDEEREVPALRDDFGTMYNSRSGVGSYYRYQPRKIAARLADPDPTALMMQDPNRRGRGFLTKVTIHESVWHRIEAGTDSYAPIVIPDRFEVLKSDGSVEPKQLPAPAEGKVSRAEWVWNDVWRRRVNYFMTVSVSVALAAFPLIQAKWPPTVCTGPQCVLSPIITSIGEVLPGFVQPWIRAFAISPLWFLILAIGILLLLARSADLKRRINDGMRELWLVSLGRLQREKAVTYAGQFADGPSGGIYALRAHPAYQMFFQALKWRIFPGVFGIFVLAAALVLALVITFVGAQRINIAWGEFTNRDCTLHRDVKETTGPVAALFKTTERCWTTNVGVTKGNRYLVTLEVAQPWIDRTIPTNPAGFETSRLHWTARPSVLLRRSLSGRWFQPMLKIVPASGRGGHIEVLDMRCDCGRGPFYSAEFVAARSGEVALFVNDVMPFVFKDLLPATGKWSELRDLYANNKGEAKVTITEIPRDPPKK
jgi:uncharacterized protein (DUF2235 family)